MTHRRTREPRAPGALAWYGLLATVLGGLAFCASGATWISAGLCDSGHCPSDSTVTAWMTATWALGIIFASGVLSAFAAAVRWIARHVRDRPE